MFQYRQALVRLRQGVDSNREIARSRLMGRPKLTAFRALAEKLGWLAAAAALPDDAQLAAAVERARRARSTISSVEPHRAIVVHSVAQGVGGVATHAVLCREHGYSGSYSSVHRMVAGLARSRASDTTVALSFVRGEAAQVDFGAGPKLLDPSCAQLRSGGRAAASWRALPSMTICAVRGSSLIHDPKRAAELCHVALSDFEVGARN